MSILERAECAVSFIQVQVWYILYITHQACRENSPGMPGKIWLVWKYGSTTGLTGQKWPAYMYFVSKPVHTCSDWMYLTNTSEYFMTFTEKKKCRFLLTNIIKHLFSMTCNFFCHFFGDLTSAIMPCTFQTPLLTCIAWHWFGTRMCYSVSTKVILCSPLLAVHQ